MNLSLICIRVLQNYVLAMISMQNVTSPHRNTCNTLLMIDLQMRLYTQAF